jgi:hypothetical protein
MTLKDLIESKDGGSCLSNTPEQNDKKFGGDYKKFTVAMMKATGIHKMTPELMKKLDAGWKSKSEKKGK